MVDSNVFQRVLVCIILEYVVCFLVYSNKEYSSYAGCPNLCYHELGHGVSIFI
jgi:hypothetical protein